tara:strand:- start:407 stop:673 length:267 start_codon:yes stop_codon:yes gene_type:complete
MKHRFGRPRPLGRLKDKKMSCGNSQKFKDNWLMEDTPEQLRDIRRTLDTISTQENRIADALEKIVELVEKVQAEDAKSAEEFAARRSL